MKRRRALLFTFSVVLALCAACGLWLLKERQQYAFNQQLIMALEDGNPTRALALVNAGADPNTRLTPTPVPSLKLLFDHLLHTTAPLNNSPTALMLACGMIWNTPEGNATRQHSYGENLPLLRAMLAHDANVNANATIVRAGLHSAIVNRRWRTVDLLMQNGADLNTLNTWGYTPVMLATWLGDWNVLHVLLLHGATPQGQTNYGSTALSYAIEARNARSILPELLAHGADPNVRDKRGLTPLQLAQWKNSPDLVRLLKQHGAK